MKKSIIVIGGGIVGVAAALQLQLDGHQVRLLDRQQPGRETSYGNAGVLSDSSVVVLNNPGLIKALPSGDPGYLAAAGACCLPAPLPAPMAGGAWLRQPRPSF